MKQETNKACPFVTSSRFSCLYFPSSTKPVKSYLQCETKHKALKSANTWQTTKQTGVYFSPFIYSFWPWCCLDQILGYLRVWEQGVNLRETAVCGGLGGDGEERKGDVSAHWKREVLRNKHQSPAHTELAVGKKCSPLQHYHWGAAPGSRRVKFKSIRWWTPLSRHYIQPRL